MRISSENTVEYLELRKARFIYFLIAVVFVVVLIVNLGDEQSRAGLTSFFYSDLSWQGVFVILLLSVLIFILVINISDNKVKLKISDEGIWIKKYNTISWKDVWYVSTEAPRGLYGKAIRLTIKLKEDGQGKEGRELSVSLAALNYDINKLWTVMSFYCSKYGVESLGHHLVKNDFV